MKKVSIEIQGRGGEICGGVLSEEIVKALESEKAVMDEYGDGIEYNEETIPFFEIDNFAHTFGANLSDATLKITVDNKAKKYKVANLNNVQTSRYCWPSNDQFFVGENTLIISYQTCKGSFGTYSFEIDDQENFDAEKLFIGVASFDEFGLEDDSFISDVFYGEIASEEFETFIENYCEIKDTSERQKYLVNNLPNGVMNVLENIEEEFDILDKGFLRFIYTCEVNDEYELESNYELQQEISCLM